MKNWMIVMLLLFTSSAFAELTPKDIQTITGIVEKSEARTREYINASEKRTREYIDTKVEALDHKFTSSIEATDRSITLIVALLIGLIALIVLAIGRPQLILFLKQRSQNAMQKELEAMQTEMQQLREAIAPLLQDRIVKP